MKRTNLVLDEKLLEEAVVVSRKRTYSEAVNEALREFIRIHRVRRLLQYRGSGIWEGDLEAMRDEGAESGGASG